jgi:hypothetical protein
MGEEFKEESVEEPPEINRNLDVTWNNSRNQCHRESKRSKKTYLCTGQLDTKEEGGARPKRPTNRLDGIEVVRVMERMPIIRHSLYGFWPWTPGVGATHLNGLYERPCQQYMCPHQQYMCMRHITMDQEAHDGTCACGSTIHVHVIFSIQSHEWRTSAIVCEMHAKFDQNSPCWEQFSSCCVRIHHRSWSILEAHIWIPCSWVS